MSAKDKASEAADRFKDDIEDARAEVEAKRTQTTTGHKPTSSGPNQSS